MATTIFNDETLELFPFLEYVLDYSSKNDIRYKTLEKSKVLVNPGTNCDHAILLIKGQLRISKKGKNNREINLYRIKPGEICPLLISSILSTSDYPAILTVDEDGEALIIPNSIFKNWLRESLYLQKVIYRLFAERFLSVVQLIDDLLFYQLDKRLLEFLLTKNEQVIYITHDELSIELGTVREVITRKMKELEKQNLIKVLRGRVEIIDSEGLMERLNAQTTI